MPGMRRSRRRYYSRDDATPLITAVIMSREEPVKGWARLQKAIQCQPNPDDHDTDGFTALMYAVRLNLPSVIPALVEAGATVDLRDEDGNTPFFYACIFRYWEVMSTLIKLGADRDVQVEHGLTPLLAAIDNQDAELVYRLLKHGASPNRCSSTEIPPLVMALSHRHRPYHPSILQNLLDAGADVNLDNREGTTPLMLAFHPRHMHAELADILIQYGAKVNLTDVQGRAAIHFCLRTAHNLQNLRLLLKAGAEVNLQDRMGATPLSVVAHNMETSLKALNTDVKRLYLRVLNDLLTCGADPNVVTCKTGPSYLMNTVLLLDNSFVAARALLAAGAEPIKSPDNTNTPLQLSPSPLITAMETGNLLLTRLLVDGLFYTHQEKVYISTHYASTSGHPYPLVDTSPTNTSSRVASVNSDDSLSDTQTFHLHPNGLSSYINRPARVFSSTRSQEGSELSKVDTQPVSQDSEVSPDSTRNNNIATINIIIHNVGSDDSSRFNAEASQTDSGNRDSARPDDQGVDNSVQENPFPYTSVQSHTNGTSSHKSSDSQIVSIIHITDLNTLAAHLCQNTPSLQQLCRREIHRALGCRRNRIKCVRQLPIWARMQRYILFQGTEYQP